MKGKGCTAATSVLVFLTFGFWLVAMVTPGWFVSSGTFYDSLDKEIRVTIEMSIFYCTLCTDGNCLNIDYSQLPLSVVTHLPVWIEIQFESVIAVLLCMMSFFFIVLNFGSPNRVKRGCVVLVIAGLTELFLVGRMWSANSKLQDEVHSPYTELESKGIYMKVQFPFSIMVALFGFLPGILAICFGVSLHAKLTQLQRDSGGRMLNLVPSQPNNYRILQES